VEERKRERARGREGEKEREREKGLDFQNRPQTLTTLPLVLEL
jgi:hypothetical protein